MNNKEIKRILEAMFFISTEPITVQQLKDVFIDADAGMIKEAIVTFQNELVEKNSALRIEEVAGGFQMTTSSDVFPYLRNFFGQKPKQKFSSASLETLAIIAYRQPVTKAEVEFIRGVNVDGVTTTLLERDIIKVVGHKEVPGRPILYGTTKTFLEVFGINDLSMLPQLKHFTKQDIEISENKL